VTFGIALLALGGFLLGGAWSVWRLESDRGGRTTPQVVVAVVLLLAALLATAAGILRLV
jgi:hypothetical protein